jgi:hypothetical protein
MAKQGNAPVLEDDALEQRFGIELPYTITLRLRGVTPFLFNRMDIEAYDSEGGPAGKRKPRSRPEYESMIWRLNGAKSNLGLPTQNVIGSIVSGGKYYKSPIGGNGSATPTLREGLVPAQEMADFGISDWDAIDFRQARYGDRKGTPKPTYRPRLEVGWLLVAHISVVTPELYGPVKLLEIATRAGSVMGVGDGRKIGFGRYVLDGHEVADGLPW